MADLAFADPALAAWYDDLNPWGPDDDFYLRLVLGARSVLDVGCGTGRLLHRAREAGHTGRLVGLDPARGMLAQARRRDDIEWVLGELASTSWHDEFDLAVMTGHAFQALVSDADIHGTLAGVRRVLTPHGRFAFETRNPLVRPWLRWTRDRTVAAAGGELRVEQRVDAPFNGRTVGLTETFTSPGWPQPRVSRSTLRFLDRSAVCDALGSAGLTVEEQFGDWDASPVTAQSPEIITIARPARGTCGRRSRTYTVDEREPSGLRA
ncbi:class I SAM-dependent DNA methyltransferase [Prauserella oleivorans]|uniref:Class I SAM-dependent DNA methyltransferase n=1 Tax=Prauserella oleivorans TaxID=1478153 RepID=A0ABW5WEQ1_9PSEU